MAPCPPPPTSLPILSSPLVQLVSFVIYVFIIPVLTAHTPTPQSLDEVLGQTVSMILSPISSSVSAFNASVMFALKIVRGNSAICGGGARTPLHDAISAGAIAIRIPIRFVSVIPEDPFGWRKLNDGIPTDETHPSSGSTGNNSTEESVLYSLPWDCRFRSPQAPTVYPASNKLKSTLAILQLAYSSFQAYMQYEPVVVCQGLSSPFLIAIPHLYMSSVNLIASLVQGSYTHVTVIRPTRSGVATTAAVPPQPLNPPPPPVTLPRRVLQVESPTHRPLVLSPHPLDEHQREAPRPTGNPVELPFTQHQSTRPNSRQDLTREFDVWLTSNFPQIEFPAPPFSLSTIAFFSHHTLSLIVVLFWIAILTTFKPGTYPFQVWLFLAIVVDPISHIMLALAQLKLDRRRWPVRSCGVVAAVKVVVWLFNLIGCVVALQILSAIYGAGGL